MSTVALAPAIERERNRALLVTAIMAALLHDVGKAIDPYDHVAAGVRGFAVRACGLP